MSRWLRLGTAAVELREPRSHLVEPLLHLAFTWMVTAGDTQRFGERRNHLVDRLELLSVVAAQAARRISSRPKTSTSAPTSSSIMSALCVGPGVKRRRSVPRGTVGKLIGWT